MRRSRRGVTLVTLLGLAALGPGCATAIDAAFDPRADFASLRVWDFEPAADVEAPGRSESSLDAELRRLIRRSFAARGYRHGRERPDFLVRYRLSIEPRVEVVRVPRAPYLLSSLSSSPSYLIEGSDREERHYDDLRLTIDVQDRSGARVWTASLRERLDRVRKPHLDAAVASLVARFPKAAPAPPPAPPPHEELARVPDRVLPLL